MTNKKLFELIGGYILALVLAYLSNLIFSFGRFINMAILVSLAYWGVIYFRKEAELYSKKYPNKK
ncbi:hypothetical protein HYX06_05930 [Candidatus Woesearchaeota archaeon]|nr:hypothetical protein [Candidatus Woesearchaeota archaeon]